ncbi:hypothetical protein [Tautonia sociabilis]|uniref:Uncharacterized protein n=1 Tax=Tautonia sociabilis TaxID=2080755 RepID=A0A432MHP4_9BACT|nr:hypothetical protein [Tautonia sociabilis]RUL86835.1 hypothetical protein TsocGM_15200 [Tautonia sociabilis]
MDDVRSQIPVKPRPRPARVIGVLNIIFGTVLLAYAVLMLAGTAFNGMVVGPHDDLERVLKDRAARGLDEQLDRLSALEAEAKAEQAKQIYRAERDRLERLGPKLPPQADIMLMSGRMGSMVAWTLVDAASGLVLNLLMVGAGVLLVQRVEWGRRLSVWVAGLKLVRLVVSQGIWLAVVVPALSRVIGQSVGDMMASQGGGPPPGMGNMTQLYAIIYSAWGVFMLVVGSIYPIVSLVVLSRPGVRAACESAEDRAQAIMREVATP